MSGRTVVDIEYEMNLFSEISGTFHPDQITKKKESPMMGITKIAL